MRFFFFAATLCSIILCSAAPDNNTYEIWYKNPATEWNEALPLGNGKLGAMVFGGIEKELIQLNEETLWSGRPVNLNPNPDAGKYLEPTRRALFAGEIDKANDLCKKMQGLYTESYMPMADLELGFDIDGANVTDYRRSLDISNAVHITEYIANGIKYRRELFISDPGRAMIMKISSDHKGAVNFSATLSSQLQFSTTANGNSITLRGHAPAHADPNYASSQTPVAYDTDGNKGMRFAVRMEIMPSGGEITATNKSDYTSAVDTLNVSGADEVVIRLVAATSYNGFDKDPYTEGKDEMLDIENYMALSADKSYEELRNGHIDDYRSFFDRVKIQLYDTTEHGDDDIKQRLVAYREGEKDLDLEALYYQFGRYLLISCSRGDSQAPANLQGIWNHHLQPPWSSNFTTNINVEMNYWPAEMCNMSEMQLPFINQIKNMAANGRHTAHNFCNANGWALAHNSDIWAQTNPVGNLGEGDPMWANWYMGSPWVCQHLYDHYRYTCDTTFLAETAYPLMKGAAEFCFDWLVDDGEGHLVTAPSTSPENTYLGDDGKPHSLTVASTMDMSVIYDLLTNVIEASELLGIDDEFYRKAIETRSKLLPLKIGRNGNLQEWHKDYEDIDPHHRHVSHLFGLHPGRRISPFATPEFAEAGRRTLLKRGDDGTGWSLAWKINFWARLLDGDHAYTLVRNLLRVVGNNLGEEYSHGGGSYSNLFCAHPPFQIDGNFGGLSGMTEMLMQSHDGTIHLLPALPSAWQKGEINGLKARGGFEVDIKWNDGRLSHAVVCSEHGNTCSIRTSCPVKVSGVDTVSKVEDTLFGKYYITSFPTEKSKSYLIAPI